MATIFTETGRSPKNPEVLSNGTPPSSSDTLNTNMNTASDLRFSVPDKATSGVAEAKPETPKAEPKSPSDSNPDRREDGAKENAEQAAIDKGTDASKTAEAKPETPTEPPTQEKLDKANADTKTQLDAVVKLDTDKKAAEGILSEADKKLTEANGNVDKAKNALDAKNVEKKEISDKLFDLKEISKKEATALEVAEERLANANPSNKDELLTQRDAAKKDARDASQAEEEKRAEYGRRSGEAETLGKDFASAEKLQGTAKEAQAKAVADLDKVKSDLNDATHKHTELAVAAEGIKSKLSAAEKAASGKDTATTPDTREKFEADTRKLQEKHAEFMKEAAALQARGKALPPKEGAAATPPAPTAAEAKKPTTTPGTETPTSPKAPTSSPEEHLASRIPDDKFTQLGDYKVLKDKAWDGKQVAIDGNMIKFGGTTPTEKGKPITDNAGYITLNEDGSIDQSGDHSKPDGRMDEATQKKIIEELGKMNITIKEGPQKKSDNPARSTVNAPAPIQKSGAPEPRDNFRGRSEITSGKPPVRYRRPRLSEEEEAGDFEPVANFR